MGIDLASVHLDKNQRYGCFFCMGSDANFSIILHLFVILIYPMAEFSIASYYLLTLSAYPIFDMMKNPYPTEDFLIKKLSAIRTEMSKMFIYGGNKGS